MCVCAKHACYDWSSYPQLKCPLSAGPQSSVSRQGCGATAGLSQESQHLGSPWSRWSEVLKWVCVQYTVIYQNLSIYIHIHIYIIHIHIYIHIYIYYIHVCIYIYMYVMILICDTDGFKCRKPSKSIQSGSKSGSAIGCRGTNGVGTSQAGGIHQALGWICGSNFLYTMYNCIQL